ELSRSTRRSQNTVQARSEREVVESDVAARTRERDGHERCCPRGGRDGSRTDRWRAGRDGSTRARCGTRAARLRSSTPRREGERKNNDRNLGAWKGGTHTRRIVNCNGTSQPSEGLRKMVTVGTSRAERRGAGASAVCSLADCLG